MFILFLYSIVQMSRTTFLRSGEICNSVQFQLISDSLEFIVVLVIRQIYRD